MKTIRTTASILLTLTALVLAGGNPGRSADSPTSRIENWRKEHDRDVLGPDGPFSLVARFTPKRGVSSLGRDRSNDIVLPVEAAPARVGKIDWPSGGDSAMLRLEPGIPAVVDGQIVSEVAVSKPVTVTIGEMKLRVAIRQSELRVSVQDANARLRRDAKPPVWFPIDLRYRITADWVAFPEAKMVRIPDSDGGSREWKSPGYASFVIDGQTVKLQPVFTPDGKELSFFFRDRTAGQETYGAGRFFETDLPKDGNVIVDFNEAYNPFCAFNTLFICPIPPRENHMPVRIEAGERNYPHAGETH